MQGKVSEKVSEAGSSMVSSTTIKKKPEYVNRSERARNVQSTPKYMVLPKVFTYPFQNYILFYPIANLLAHNNLITSFNVQVNSVRLKLNVALKWASKHLCGVPFILLLPVP